MARLAILAYIFIPESRDYRQYGMFAYYFIYEPGVDLENIGFKGFHTSSEDLRL